MTFAAYFIAGMAVMALVVLIGFLIGRMEAADYFSPTKQAERSAEKALRDAQL